VSFKTWIASILVALGTAGGFLAAHIQGDVIPDSNWGVSCAPAWAVFDAKKRCGFVDLGELVAVSGRVKKTKIHQDGDFSLDIVPEPQYEWVLSYKGQARRSYIHVEFMPCERTYADVEPVLQEVARRIAAGETVHVRVVGRWAYDGVDHNGEWRKQLSTCLETREPDPALGWTEIHPGYTIRIRE